MNKQDPDPQTWTSRHVSEIFTILFIFFLQNGQTALCIAQKLGYISVVETLKVVTDQVSRVRYYVSCGRDRRGGQERQEDRKGDQKTGKNRTRHTVEKLFDIPVPSQDVTYQNLPRRE